MDNTKTALVVGKSDTTRIIAELLASRDFKIIEVESYDVYEPIPALPKLDITDIILRS